jgi:hypothetical protein
VIRESFTQYLAAVIAYERDREQTPFAGFGERRKDVR